MPRLLNNSSDSGDSDSMDFPMSVSRRSRLGLSWRGFIPYLWALVLPTGQHLSGTKLAIIS